MKKIIRLVLNAKVRKNKYFLPPDMFAHVVCVSGSKIFLFFGRVQWVVPNMVDEMLEKLRFWLYDFMLYKVFFLLYILNLCHVLLHIYYIFICVYVSYFVIYFYLDIICFWFVWCFFFSLYIKNCYNAKFLL